MTHSRLKCCLSQCSSDQSSEQLAKYLSFSFQTANQHTGQWCCLICSRKLCNPETIASKELSTLNWFLFLISLFLDPLVFFFVNVNVDDGHGINRRIAIFLVPKLIVNAMFFLLIHIELMHAHRSKIQMP